MVLDWIVFNDSRVAALQAAHAAGELTLVSRADCVEELLRVLAYPNFKLSALEQADAMLKYRALLGSSGLLAEEADPERLFGHLPRCKDPDDQKFLETAAQGAASAIISKDKRLLELNRGCQAVGFVVCTPVQPILLREMDAR